MSDFRVTDESPRFVQLWDAVFFDEHLSNNAKIVYGVLQRMAWECRDKELAPSHDEIGRRANVKDRKTVAACLNALEERGHIRREGRGKWETAVIILAAPAPNRGGNTDTAGGEKSPTPRGEKTDTYRGEKTDTYRGEKTDTYRGEKTDTLYRTTVDTIDTPPCVPPQEKIRRTRLDARWRPDPALWLWTQEKGWDAARIEVELEKFHNYHGEVKRTLAATWPGTWRTWVLNGMQWDVVRAANRPKTQADHNSASQRKLVY